MLKLAVLIVSWNNECTISRCLSSIENAEVSDVDLSVAVWDNDSRDDTVERARAAAPTATIHRSERNIGFARGINELASRTTADALLVLNPDAYVRPDAIQLLVDAFRSGSAVVGGRLVGTDGREQAPCARPFPGTYRTIVWVLSGNRQRWTVPSQTQAVDAVSGAFMLIARQMWDTVGGFDASYPHSGEDLAFCWNVQRQRGRITFVPEALAEHELEASVKQAPPQIDVLRWFGIVKFAEARDGRIAVVLLRAALVLKTSALLGAALLRVPGARNRDLARGRLLWRWAVSGRLPPLPDNGRS